MTDSKDIQNPHRFMHPMASQLLTCGFTGILAEIIYYPFLTIWTTQNSKNLSFRKACSAIKRGNGFYAGFSLSLKSVIPIAALYLLGKDLPLKLGDNAVTHCLQGFAGQGLSTLCYEPAIKLMMLAQTAKTKEKTDPFNQLSITKKIHTLLLKEGLRGLYGAAIPGYL
ncbi:MAG: hypothetical protein NTU49_03725, partial [Gammaproteobacteria bacterium]|nr:hypothetical protein [Gammaproteobacteria bacterium]